MTISALDATNLSVANAGAFVDSVKNNSRVLSFFLGGDSVETSADLNDETRRRDVFKTASVISRINPAGCNVVVPDIKWVRGKIYGKWNTNKKPDSTYYVTYNNNVYLILGNSDLNTKKDSGKIPVSTPPTHTSGVVTYGDGYTYLFLYTISATDKANVNSSGWIAVPDKVLTSYAGKITSLEIDLSAISTDNLIIKEIDPVIPILSDSGSGASIKLEGVVVSSPYATLSERKYKLVGIKYVNTGTSVYRDFNLRDSLTAILTRETASHILEIFNAITLGFSVTEGMNIREILGAKYAIINCETDSAGISGSVDQREFFNFGIFENIVKSDFTPVFTGSYTQTNISNQVKTVVAPLSGASASSGNFDVGNAITLTKASGATRTSSDVVVASTQPTAFTIGLEVHTLNINDVQTGDKIKLGKTSEEYTVTSVTRPDVKQNSGKTLHIGATRFSIDTSSSVNKRFFAQIIQRF